ncbi:hypothetical protein SPHINGO8AM_170075 [Sphingomonas sp. 8AM]|nr:hypothetical protein SPHINGO8AM_170075 [Sphingomonas sp. 8AM]
MSGYSVGRAHLPTQKRPKQDPNARSAARAFARAFRGFLLEGVVPLTGLEPVTPALRMRCSTS